MQSLPTKRKSHFDKDKITTNIDDAKRRRIHSGDGQPTTTIAATIKTKTLENTKRIFTLFEIEHNYIMMVLWRTSICIIRNILVWRGKSNVDFLASDGRAMFEQQTRQRGTLRQWNWPLLINERNFINKLSQLSVCNFSFNCHQSILIKTHTGRIGLRLIYLFGRFGEWSEPFASAMAISRQLQWAPTITTFAFT